MWATISTCTSIRATTPRTTSTSPLPSIAPLFRMSLDELFDWSSQLDEGQIREAAARIALRANGDPEGACAEAERVTAEHLSCWPRLLQAAMYYSGRAAVGPARADEMRGGALDCLDRVEARSGDAGQLARARFVRAGFLRMQGGGSEEAIARKPGRRGRLRGQARREV